MMMMMMMMMSEGEGVGWLTHSITSGHRTIHPRVCRRSNQGLDHQQKRSSSPLSTTLNNSLRTIRREQGRHAQTQARPLACKSDGGVQSAASPPTLPIWRNLLISLNCDQGLRQSVQIEGSTCHSGQVAGVDGDDLGKWLRRGPIGGCWCGPGRVASQKSLLTRPVAGGRGPTSPRTF